MLKIIERINDGLCKIERCASLVLFVIIMLVMTAQVIMRYCFNDPITWSEEFCRYCYVWIVWIGCATCASHREHTRIPVLYDKLPPKAQKALTVVGDLIIIAVLLYILPYSARFAAKQHMFKSGVMRVPMSVVFWPVAVTCVLTSLQIFLSTLLFLFRKEAKEPC